MKSLFNLLLSAWILLTVTACTTVLSQITTSTAVPIGPHVRGVFQGITPCSNLTRPLPQIPEDSHCEQLIWNVVLYQDPVTGIPTTYALNSAYGVPKQGTTGLAGGGTTIVMEGRTPCHEIVFEFTNIAPYSGCMKIKWRLTLYQEKTTGAPSTYLYMGTSTIREGTWKIVRGADSDPDAIIYQLHPGSSQQHVSFLKADENHLFLLDRGLNFLVGDALWSYTLSRVG